MANIVSDTTWHGNPRPIESYCSTVYDKSVVSPYYAKSMGAIFVPVHNTYNTPIPLSDLAPTAGGGELGPAPLVGWEMNGLWTSPTQLQVAITVTGGTGDISTSIAFSDDLLGPVDAAVQVAAALQSLSAEIEVLAVEQEIYIQPIAPATSLTITTLTVV